ncbi:MULTISPECIES: LysR substrate-binding domain-containing protein [unclassified Tolypothrix]|uniref:LysR substrate-binding domain-containing protein n=1 Tax=unclassified Tolypothrix TaxID=2649714 RepID=UPI0005EABB56|nr:MULTISPECIES: LysR substrate-binding domain-containing protein [unclassified Tolypothrix]BAY92529.1 LysR family transcriptional regulator [Microchaete diplosiphon NIES-3275]EKF05591.1 LysR family transcriptional regulator [Tolypothrix sp. PCC 7601]MBE9085427.1 LysR family transcriptional regulator [Tolypothrix sp. LEGE 11397]UYD26482.1 LysR family transcriptional regulator [Tolypothrix sp. PCC 7712]UYD31279.1 LysR family transcriptional regulator [Tolypothrix sp. PCC 7601]
MAGMTLDQLRIFLAVAEHLHFTRAAEELYITQPAVSAAIQSLEQEYRVKLFHRIGRHIEIAEAGKLLQEEARKILDQVSLTERGLRELNNLQRGELKLGSSLTIGNYWLPSKISEFKSQYPGISVNCTLANAETICAGTVMGQFDLGLVEGDVKPELQTTMDYEIIGSDRLQIVVGQTHPWFERGEIVLTELTQTPWVMREPGSGTQQRFEEALQNWGINLSQLDVMLVFNSGEMAKAAVESGVGATGISELMVKKEIQLGTLRAIQVIDNRNSSSVNAEIIRPFFKLKHRQRFQTALSKAFEEMLITSHLHNSSRSSSILALERQVS